MFELTTHTEIFRLHKLNSKYHKMYDYFIDNQHVGRFVIESIDNYYILWKVKIFDEYRGKGYGKRMMIDLLSHFNDKTIYLYVREDNTIAIKLYEKLGFKLTKDKIKHIIRANKFLGLIKYKLSFK